MEFNEYQKKYLYELLYDCSRFTGAIAELLESNSKLGYGDLDAFKLENIITKQKESLDRCVKNIKEDCQCLLENNWLDEKDE